MSTWVDAHLGEIIALIIAGLGAFFTIGALFWRKHLALELAVKDIQSLKDRPDLKYLTERVDTLEAKMDKAIESSHTEHADMRKENSTDHKEVQRIMAKHGAELAALRATVTAYIKSQQQRK